MGVDYRLIFAWAVNVEWRPGTAGPKGCDTGRKLV
jgi:hypothetical protein